jgi:hypothetical protein
MPTCPVCFGEGSIDMRDMDAYLSEHVLGTEPCGIVECDECETTGVVSPERLTEIAVYSRAAVDQILARIEAEDAACPPPVR